MKKIIRFLFVLLLCQQGYAQHVYQIRADSVRIYNVCDTAELIIENRTRGVNGFLYNKGNGRTEFRRLRLENIGGSQIAISGQDTLDISTLSAIRGVDTIYRSGDNIHYVKRGVAYAVYAPLPANETLESVTSRGATTTQTIRFNSSTGNPSNGLSWLYNTDTWKIFVESAQDTPAGNMILESADNGNEGWIFRNNAPNEQGVLDILSLGRDRFNYKGGAVWHAGNHAAGSAFSPALTGANVLASLTTNASGHVTAATTRTLTAGDIAAVPETPSAASWSGFATIPAGRFMAAATGAPNAGNWYGLHLGGDANNSAQIAFKNNTGYFRTYDAGVMGSWLQFADRNWVTSNFAASSGSTAYINNQLAAAQNANGWISGSFRSASYRADGGVLQLYKDGSNAISDALQLRNAAGTRGVNFQLNGDTNPGLATWIFNGSTWVKRLELLADGSNATFFSNLTTNGGWLSLGNIPAASSGTSFLTSGGTGFGQIQHRTAAQVLSDIGAASSNIPLSVVLTNGNTANSSITLGASGVTTNYVYQVIRNNGTTNYTGQFGVGAGSVAGAAMATIDGSGTNPNRILYLPSGVTTARYSPDAGTTLYDMWHSGNHPSGTSGSITYTGAEVPSSFSFNAAGHYTASGKRSLTAGDISAVPSNNLTTSGWNTFNGSSFFAGFNSSGTNAPTGVTYFGTVVTSSSGYGYQTAFRGNSAYFRTLEAGTYGSWLQFADRSWVTSNFASSSGSGNYVQNQTAAIQTASSRINGDYRTDGGSLSLFKNGSNSQLTSLRIMNSDGSRGANIQLNGDAIPGLSTWIYDGAAWQRRFEILSSGYFVFPNIMSGSATSGVSITNIPVLGTTATNYLTSNSGTISSRTSAQVLSDIGAAPASGSGNYVQNQITSPQSASFLINGIGRFERAGSNSFAGTLSLYNVGRTRGAHMQLNADANPGLSFWIHNGTAETKRLELLATGKTIITSGENEVLRLTRTNGHLSFFNDNGGRTGFIDMDNTSAIARFYTDSARPIQIIPGGGTPAGTFNLNKTFTIGSVPAYGSPATTFLTHVGGNVQSRTAAQVLNDIGAAPSSGSGNYIQSLSSGIQAANFRIGGYGVFFKNGSSAVSNQVTLLNSAAARGVNFQLNGDTNPGLAVWVTNSSGTWTKKMEILADGKTLMNGATNDGTNAFQVNGSIASNASVLATSFYQSSLRSLKKNIHPFTGSALSILTNAPVKTFQFKADSTGKTNIGFIADEVPDEIAIPGRKGVDQASTVALLVKSIQELNSRNKELERRIESLEALLSKMLNEKKEQDEN